MKFFNSIMGWFLKLRIPQIEHFISEPIEVQKETFTRLIESARETEWGIVHDYKSIKSIADYKARVPISSYDELKPYVDRIMKGEQNILWPSEITWFAKSSGTTADRSKFIPVSSEALEDCHFKAGRDVMALYFQQYPDTKVFSGRGIIMGGSSQINSLNKKARYGDVSAVLMQNMPLLAQIIKTPSLKTALLENYEEKIEQIARETLHKNVTHIVGVPTWTVVLIKRLFEITGKDNLADIWPNLELYIHGGVSFTPYRELFKQLIRKNDMHYMETYNASEGFFGIQNEPGKTDMLLMLDYGIFYEFLPMEELGKEYPKTLQLDEVEIGKNYALVISTNAGLWRYMIGDTVRFTSRYPFKIKISGRTKQFINAFGEELIVDNADTALRETCAALQCVVRDYTAGPVYFEGDVGEGKGGHEWIIEFEREASDREQFVELLDRNLRKVNSDYDAKRQHDLALLRPIIHFAPDGTFYHWMKKRGKLGGQHKVPRLANDRKYLEDILLLMSEHSE